MRPNGILRFEGDWREQRDFRIHEHTGRQNPGSRDRRIGTARLWNAHLASIHRIVLAGSALVAVCAHLALPLYFTRCRCRWRRLLFWCWACCCAPAWLPPRWVLPGGRRFGLPVFSPTPALPGLAHLVGPTGGYLLSYPLTAALIAFLVLRFGEALCPQRWPLPSAASSFWPPERSGWPRFPTSP